MVCLSKTALYDRIRSGRFPATVSLGPKKVVFLESEIEAWIQAQILYRGDYGDTRRVRALNAVKSRRDRTVKYRPLRDEND
jgi:Prophage CP4-57 regulatory protein (AlpA)